MINLIGLNLLEAMKAELCAYLTAAAQVPAFDTADVTTFTACILRWWREHET